MNHDYDELLILACEFYSMDVTQNEEELAQEGVADKAKAFIETVKKIFKKLLAQIKTFRIGVLKKLVFQLDLIIKKIDVNSTESIQARGLDEGVVTKYLKGEKGILDRYVATSKNFNQASVEKLQAELNDFNAIRTKFSDEENYGLNKAKKYDNSKLLAEAKVVRRLLTGIDSLIKLVEKNMAAVMTAVTKNPGANLTNEMRAFATSWAPSYSKVVTGFLIRSAGKYVSFIKTTQIAIGKG